MEEIDPANTSSPTAPASPSGLLGVTSALSGPSAMRVLVIDDEPISRLVLRRLLGELGFAASTCGSAEEAMKECELNHYPLLFLDLFLPGMDGFAFCRWVRGRPEGDSHLILAGTSSDRPQDLEKILVAGADDYIVKPYRYDHLSIRLAIARQRVQQIETRKKLEAELRREREHLQFLARHDVLTKLLNRASLVGMLEELTHAAKIGLKSALLYIDLDHFKNVNDQAGHAVGDRVLIEVATVLLGATRQHDAVFRLGGDEFAAIIRQADLAEVYTIAERMREGVEDVGAAQPVGGERLGASIGISVIDGAALPEQIIMRADAACYQAKSHGRNRIATYDGASVRNHR